MAWPDSTSPLYDLQCLPLRLVKVVESELCLFSRGSCENIKLFIVLQKGDELLIFFFCSAASLQPQQWVERGERIRVEMRVKDHSVCSDLSFSLYAVPFWQI